MGPWKPLRWIYSPHRQPTFPTAAETSSLLGQRTLKVLLPASPVSSDAPSRTPLPSSDSTKHCSARQGRGRLDAASSGASSLYPTAGRVMLSLATS